MPRFFDSAFAAVTAICLMGCSSGMETPSGTGTPTSLRVCRPQNPRVEKIDLLFLIDNSASMTDKQNVLASAVPEFVERFTNPVCVHRETREYAGTVAPGETCSTAFPETEREFDPIVDIHIGIITSSLGGVGADSCSDVGTQYYHPHQEDMARLITRGKDDAGETIAVPTYENMGFLNWDPTGKKSTPPGESNVNRLKQSFTDLVRGAGQDGCGFEMSLEAWRRFLVDPAPCEKLVPVPCNESDTRNGCRSPEGVDQIVLQQRKDFLRNDSLLAIVMLSDENDCSVIAGGQFYRALQPFPLARGTDACMHDPWSESCKSCWEVKPEDFPECAAGWPNPDKDDPINLRCFEQKRRFGVDFLYPVRRYIDALTEERFADDTLNPVFCNEFTDDTRTECTHLFRDPSLIFLAGIVGVPWQDLAVDPWDLKKGYRPVEQLSWVPSMFASNNQTPPPELPEGKTLWNMILGEVDESPGFDADGDGRITGSEKNPRYGAMVPTVTPLDPLMIESVDPRSGKHPITGVPLVQPGTNPVGHPVNASERTIPARNDLQYACVFDLGLFGPIDCTLKENAFGCDCAESPEGSADNPLCWNASTGDYGTDQFRAKAYPGRRQLAVLKGMDSQAILASICPSNTHDPQAEDFGYRPAVRAITDRLKAALQTCFGLQFEIADDGRVPFAIIEATRLSPEEECTCTGVRSTPSRDQVEAIERAAPVKENTLNCFCELKQVTPGPDLQACVSQETVTGVQGWCYVDPAQDASHNPDLVASCPPANKRNVRFLGASVPVPGALAIVLVDPRVSSCGWW